MKINLKVMVLDTDYYALRAINSYLAWDRRTRVIAMCQQVEQAMKQLRKMSQAEQPNFLLLDTRVANTPTEFVTVIERFRKAVPNLAVLCLAHHADPLWVEAADKHGARGYLLRDEVRVFLVGAILHALEHPFVITPGVRSAAVNMHSHDAWLAHADLLPDAKKFPELTERVRQALWLCVIEGMPANLAADEMGIAPNTIRSYIKDGYRILEANDPADYPEEMSPLERAFVRFTALEAKEDLPTEKRPTDER
jgi:DNA-binding NarL/FixJ family response regulator